MTNLPNDDGSSHELASLSFQHTEFLRQFAEHLIGFLAKFTRVHMCYGLPQEGDLLLPVEVERLGEPGS